MKASMTILMIVATSVIALAGPLNPLAFTSSGILDLPPGNYTINTGGANPVLQDSGGTVLATGSFYVQGELGFDAKIAVLDFSVINVPSGVTISVQGPNPLALLSRSSITFSGTINAIGGNGQPENDQGEGSLGGLGNVGGANGGNGGGGNHLPGWPGYGPGGGPSNGVYGLTILAFGVGGGYGGRGADNGDECYTPGCSPRQSNIIWQLKQFTLGRQRGKRQQLEHLVRWGRRRRRRWRNRVCCGNSNHSYRIHHNRRRRWLDRVGRLVGRGRRLRRGPAVRCSHHRSQQCPNIRHWRGLQWWWGPGVIPYRVGNNPEYGPEN